MIRQLQDFLESHKIPYRVNYGDNGAINIEILNEIDYSRDDWDFTVFEIDGELWVDFCAYQKPYSYDEIVKMIEELGSEDTPKKYQRRLPAIKSVVGNNTDNWHEYPQESPPEEAEKYLVTLSDNLDGSGDRFVDVMYWTGKYWTDFSIGIPERTVVAWSELPKPYES